MDKERSQINDERYMLTIVLSESSGPQIYGPFNCPEEAQDYFDKLKAPYPFLFDGVKPTISPVDEMFNKMERLAKAKSSK